MGFYKNIGNIRERLKKLLNNKSERFYAACGFSNKLFWGDLNIDRDTKKQCLTVTYKRKEHGGYRRASAIDTLYEIPILQTNIISILSGMLSSHDQDIDNLYVEVTIGDFNFDLSRAGAYFIYNFTFRDKHTEDLMYILCAKFEVSVDEHQFYIKPKQLVLKDSGLHIVDCYESFDIVKIR